MQENARRIGPLTGNRVRRQLSERRVHPSEENAGDCAQDTKCNSGDLMLALPIQRVHLALFALQPELDQAADGFVAASLHTIETSAAEEQC